jgi:hypothetical protein|tara:strand:- start:4178 stop:4306 length:129 start_codon:yes stop_codon:yes gene_type:complete
VTLFALSDLWMARQHLLVNTGEAPAVQEMAAKKSAWRLKAQQ